MLKPNLYMLIGVPGSGKSTFVHAQSHEFVYISSDYYVEKFAKKMGKTYNEVFSLTVKRADRLMMRAVRRAREKRLDIIWDQTNTTAKSRAKKLAMLPEYNKTALYFETPPADILAERLANRPGKEIPHRVMKSMIQHLKKPTLDEGFTKIQAFTTF